MLPASAFMRRRPSAESTPRAAPASPLNRLHSWQPLPQLLLLSPLDRNHHPARPGDRRQLHDPQRTELLGTGWQIANALRRVARSPAVAASPSTGYPRDARLVAPCSISLISRTKRTCSSRQARAGLGRHDRSCSGGRATTLRALATYLNEHETTTTRGAAWTAAAIQRLIVRFATR